MKKVLSIAAAMILLLAVNSMAITWTWAGDVFDQTIFDYNDNWSPVPQYPGVPTPHVPSPGGSIGEMFDFEGSKFAMDDDYLYFAVTSSFGMGVTYDGFEYLRGDFFFGFNGNDIAYAVDMSSNDLVMNTTTPLGIPVTPAGYHNNLSIVNFIGAYEISQADIMGGANVMLHQLSDAYVLEMRLAKSSFGIDWNTVETVHLRETISCGNDLIMEDYNVIPEPTTLTLLGLGLLGAGIIARRKK